MFKQRVYKLTSVKPGLLLHNGQLSDPLNQFVKAIKPISGKRNKTEADHEEIARLEFLGSLYVNDNGPVIPQNNMRKAIIEAARKMKLGKKAEVGIFVVEEVELAYDGPREPDELWKAGFYDRRQAGVNRSSVMRTRPHFASWDAEVTIEYDTEFVDADVLDEWMYICGRQIGVGDFRPGKSGGVFGRFNVEVLD